MGELGEKTRNVDKNVKGLSDNMKNAGSSMQSWS